MELSEELCEIIGCFIGDGHAYKTKDNHYIVQFSGHAALEKDYYEKIICPYILKLFNSVGHIKKVKEKNVLRINFYSKSFYYFLKEFLDLKSSNKTSTINIPDFLFEEQNSLYLNKLIRSLIDTDGYVFLDKRSLYKKPYPRICFYTTSEPLYNQLVNHLPKYFNIRTYQRNRNPPKTKTSFTIEIYGFDQLNTWIKMIGFSNQKHLSKLPA